jgi:hypothetical protein
MVLSENMTKNKNLRLHLMNSYNEVTKNKITTYWLLELKLM